VTNKQTAIDSVIIQIRQKLLVFMQNVVILVLWYIEEYPEHEIIKPQKCHIWRLTNIATWIYCEART